MWLLVGALAVGLILILRIRSEYLTTRAIAALSGARLVTTGALPSRLRRWVRVVVVSLAVAMGFVALARPQTGMKWQTVDRNGTDLLLVVDTSKSMNADDVSPTRLERTKLAVRDLVEKFPGDRIGLVAFAGDAFLESPMTLDHDALLDTLGAFDTSVISRGGTDIGRAIDIGSEALKAQAGDPKVMVLLTDGEDLEGNGLEAAKRASELGIMINTVGVGTPAGELVPAKNEQGVTVGLVRDDSGAPVRSRLDEPGLRAIAQATHGTYRPLGADGRGLDRLYADSLAQLSRTERGAQVRRVYVEWFGVPLALSIFGIVFDALLGWKPRARNRAKPSFGHSSTARLGAIAAVALGALLPARAQASVQDAEKQYAAGKFEDSARQYVAEQARHPKDARIAVDTGAADYRAGHFDAAEAALTKALTVADPKLQERVLYDMGDARYRLGATKLKDAPDQTIEHWKAAIAAYDGALALSPADGDARFNRDFVKRKLDELEKKQKQQPQDNSSKSDPKSGDSKKDQAGQKDASSGKPSEPTSKDGKANGASGNASSQGQPSGNAQNGNAQNGSAPKGPQPNSTGTDAHNAAAQHGGQIGADPGNGQEKKEEGAGTTAGQLSPRDARALLQSLRGEERRGVSFGTSSAPPTDDSPQKDW
jgi:Ca-activated chloride channel family protein